MEFAALIIVFLQYRILKTLYKSTVWGLNCGGFEEFKATYFMLILCSIFAVIIVIASIIVVSRSAEWDVHSIIIGFGYVYALFVSYIVRRLISVSEKAIKQKYGKVSKPGADGSDCNMRDGRIFFLDFSGIKLSNKNAQRQNSI